MLNDSSDVSRMIPRARALFIEPLPAFSRRRCTGWAADFWNAAAMPKSSESESSSSSSMGGGLALGSTGLFLDAILSESRVLLRVRRSARI